MRDHGARNLRFGRVNFIVHSFDKISVDDVLAHKSREVLFHLKTRQKWACSLTAADIRRDLVRSDLNG